jgi:hypothetical protein
MTDGRGGHAADGADLRRLLRALAVARASVQSVRCLARAPLQVVTHAHTRTHACTHTRTHTCTHALTYMHTNTHVRMPRLLASCTRTPQLSSLIGFPIMKMAPNRAFAGMLICVYVAFMVLAVLVELGLVRFPE